MDVHENDVHADVRRVAYPRDFVYSSYVDYLSEKLLCVRKAVFLWGNFRKGIAICGQSYYNTNHGLNAGGKAGYFDKEGVLVYHINASL